MALTKVSGGILDPGIDVAGIVTATGFDGPFVGGSSKNITAGTVTATELDINGNVDISGNLTVHGDTTTLNTTLRNVELLRVNAQDDSVAAGIITQTGSSHGLVLADDNTLKMAMNVGSGIATFRALNASYSNHNGASGIFQQVNLNTAAVTFGNTISVNGATITTGNGSHRIRSAANDFAIEHTTNSYKGFRILGNVPENTLVVDDGNSGSVGIGTVSPTQKLDVYSGTAGRPTFRHSSGFGGVQIAGPQDASGASLMFTRGYDVVGGGTTTYSLFLDGSTQTLHFVSGDPSEYETKTRLLLNPSGKVGIGTITPRTILHLHDSTNTRIQFTDDGTGAASSDGVIAGLNGDDDFFINNRESGKGIKFFTGSDDERLGITSAGEIKIPSGTNSTSRLTFGGGINIYHDGNMKFENATGYLKLQSNNNLYIDGNEIFLRNEGGTNRWKIDSSGHFLPGAVGSYDIGGSNAGIGSVYLADDKKAYFGNDQDLSLYTTGSNGFIENGTGYLLVNSSGGDTVIRSNNDVYLQPASGENAVKAEANGSVDLYYDQNNHTTPKLKTTATGITVDGEVVASQDYPNFRPIVDFNFVAEKKLDPMIDYERTGVASFVNELGKIEFVGGDAPRFDHDPVTKDCKGLLIEESRKNYLENSDFVSSYGSGGSWAYGVGTDVFSASSGSQLSTNPDESSPAYHYAPSSVAGYHRFNRSFTLDAYDTSYVVSVFAKRVTTGSASGLNRYLEIEISGGYANNGAPTGHSGTHGMSGITYDLQDGVVENPSTNYYGYVGDAKMEKFADDWWRLSYVFNPGTNDGSSTLTGQIWFGHPTSVGSDDGTETGNGNPSFYLWGAMIEKGSNLTSYVPNHGAYQITRGSDIVRIMDDNFTNIFGTKFENFSVVADFDNSNSLDGNNASILEWWSDNNNYEDRIQIMKDNSSPYHIETRGFGGNSAIFSNGNLSASSKAASNRLATSWSVDYSTNNAANRKWSFSFSGEAVDVVNDNSGTTTPALTRFGIGCSPYKLDLTRGILLFKRLIIYNRSLSDNQLRTLTS